jgi:hypothetical protein
MKVLLLSVLALSLSLSYCIPLSAVVQQKEIALGYEPEEFWFNRYVVHTIQSSSGISYDPYDAGKVVVSRNWPDNLGSVSGWVGYGAYLIMVFLSPFVVLIVLCNVAFYFWCCRKCGACGGAKPGKGLEGYEKKERRILLIPIDIIFAAIV